MKYFDPIGNLLLKQDSYKPSHPFQLPDDTRAVSAYLEARVGAQYSHTLVFGLQYILNHYFDLTDCPISRHDVKIAAEFWKAHGEPFHENGWMRVVDVYGGRLPVTIRAPKEGTLVPINNALITVDTEDDELWWLPGQMETALMRVWYPMTVATRSFFGKQVILRHLRKSADDPKVEVGFKLHDFGGRGATSDESAGIGGMSHLVNFMGTDTAEGIIHANLYYPENAGPEALDFVMHGFSIPAMEHFTVLAWLRNGEIAAFRNALQKFKEKGFKMVACVSDTYDIFNAVENIWCGELLQEVKDSGMTVVIRPDSGDAVEVNREILRIMARKLGPEMKVNSKGYMVLPDYYRIIQGDGNNDETDIDRVLTGIEDAGFSASNIAFGMGGGLHQKLDRDTQRFAFKPSAIKRGNKWHDVRKTPKTDMSKASKGGRLDLARIVSQHGCIPSKHLITVDRDKLQKTTTTGTLYDPESENYVRSETEVVFQDGYVTREQTFSEIRKLADEQTLPEVA